MVIYAALVLVSDEGDDSDEDHKQKENHNIPKNTKLNCGDSHVKLLINSGGISCLIFNDDVLKSEVLEGCVSVCTDVQMSLTAIHYVTKLARCLT